MSDQQQILRLLATIREEVADIRSRQEELYEILLSYKDQIQEVKSLVEDGLQGLPKSPYIAGQLVPAPDHVDGVDEFGQLLATYLHKAPRGHRIDLDQPRDVEFTPQAEIHEDDVKLEANTDKPRRRGGGGGGRGHDSDLERGPERGIVPIDLEDGPKKKKKRRRRTRRRKKKEDGEEGVEVTADGGSDDAAGPESDADE